MDVKILLLRFCLLSAFSFLIAWCFLKPVRKSARKPFLVDSFPLYKNVFIGLSQLVMALLLFNHVYLAQSKLDHSLVFLILSLIGFGNLVKWERND